MSKPADKHLMFSGHAVDRFKERTGGAYDEASFSACCTVMRVNSSWRAEIVRTPPSGCLKRWLMPISTGVHSIGR